jgi:hypothetical protein
MNVEEEIRYLRDEALRLSTSVPDVVYAYGWAERAVAYGKTLWVLTSKDEDYALLEQAWRAAKVLRAKAEGRE